MRPLFLKYDRYIECRLCPHLCKIAPGKTGICGVRKNTGAEIELLTYGVISGHALDPIEKKPLYHFFPGYNILSIGSYGCNLRCDFCQNWQISQERTSLLYPNTTIEKLEAEALASGKNIGIAFTYNEPVIWFEFVRDVALKIKERGLFTVMVSNGFINSRPLDELLRCIDAFNIDLKAFNDNFYKKLTGAEIEPVKSSLKQIAKTGKHLEITTLVIPGRNDSIEEMEEQCRWISNELGDEIPLHLSRYFPVYKRSDPSTPVETLFRLQNSARKYLKHVYLGNTGNDTGHDTKCSSCGTLVTKRSGYMTQLVNLTSEGNCVNCGNLIYKWFKLPSRGGN